MLYKKLCICENWSIDAFKFDLFFTENVLRKFSFTETAQSFHDFFLLLAKSNSNIENVWAKLS